MIKVLIGKKGSGKTKMLIDRVNETGVSADGDVVFISNNTKRHMYDISHTVRMVDTSEFALDSYDEVYGFVCGLISNNFDISHIFVDSVTKIAGDHPEKMEKFFDDIENLSKQFNVSFFFTISMSADEAPACIQSFV